MINITIYLNHILRLAEYELFAGHLRIIGDEHDVANRM